MASESKNSEQDLEGFRDYLNLLARLQLNGKLRGKIDVSGIVQQTLLEAHQALAHVTDRGEAIQAAWLRQILAHNLGDEIRKFTTGARDVDREQSLEAALARSSCRLGAWLAANDSSPSQKAVRQEELLHLAGALTRLPEDQRQAVELHHLQGLPLSDVAEQMSRTKGAVAQLLFRGLKKLRELLTEGE
jgi:RNA polymerase sigma-70 factor (ECF subfamily)